MSLFYFPFTVYLFYFLCSRSVYFLLSRFPSLLFFCSQFSSLSPNPIFCHRKPCSFSKLSFLFPYPAFFLTKPISISQIPFYFYQFNFLSHCHFLSPNIVFFFLIPFSVTEYPVHFRNFFLSNPIYFLISFYFSHFNFLS